MNIDLSQYSFDAVAVNAVVVWFIQRMKTSDARIFAWISAATPHITRTVSVLMAAVTAVGMEISYNMQDGGGTLTISNITTANLALLCWYMLKNYVFQHIIYKVGYKEEKA